MVVRRVIIPVVDNLQRQKGPSQFLLHHKSMLSDVAACIAEGVIRLVPKDVARLVSCHAAFPAGMAFPR